jgi:hypothetical protein
VTWREYVLQVVAHRRRVRLLGLMCVTGAGRALCWWHDIEKFVFLPWLFKYRCGGGDRAAAARLYLRLNAVGHFIERMVLWPYGEAQRGAARRFARVVDCLDRSMDPVARVELGDAENPPPLSRFLTGAEIALAEALRPYWAVLFGEELVQTAWMTEVVVRDAWRQAWKKNPDMARGLAPKDVPL